MPASTPPADPIGLSANARTVLERRYLVKGPDGKPVETPEQLFWRVATVVAEAERRHGATEPGVQATAEAFYRLMTDGRFLPNSPTLMNAGRPLGQLSACFVLPVADALSNGHDGIYDTLRAMALIHQSGGGTGFSFSRLRPSGSMVRSTTGVASGPVSFMELYDASTEAVKQGGTRRGANMGILRVDHPDIRTFIHCKDDLTKITNFNVSVAVTSAFMEAVETGAAYDLMHPQTGVVVGQLDARTVWNELIDGAWKTGEPGVFFIDEANRYNPVPHLGAYEATNPCVTGDTLVYTAEGMLPIGVLASQQRAAAVSLDARFGAGAFGPAGVPFSSGKKAVFRLRTVEGYELRCTGDHRVMTARGWVSAAQLIPGDRVHLLNGGGGFGRSGNEAEGRVLGWIIADGHITGDSGHGAVLGFWGDDRELAPELAADVNAMLAAEEYARAEVGVVEIAERSASTASSARLKRILAERFGLTAETKATAVPLEVLAGSEAMQRGFLRAIYQADGHVSGSPAKGVSVRLTSTSASLLRDVQRLLLNFGVASRLYCDRHPARTVTIGGKTYESRPDHDLVVGKDNVLRFAERIGFLGAGKQNRLVALLGSYAGRGPYRESFTARFAALDAEGVEEVFDLTEPLTHSFSANGLVVHNCGEQPLLAYDVCNLGSVNVGWYVRDGAMDWAAFERDVALATRFLDNVIDVNKFPLPEIAALSQRIRRIGLGVMGFADMLVRLGVPYDSAEGVELGRRVMATLDEAAKRESERLAAERGTFPEWARSIWGPDETCARDASGARIRPMRALRHCNVTTVAPTGTISILAGCSSGLEPLFAVAFMRNQAGVMMPDVNADFVAIARREGWYSEALMTRIATEGHIRLPEVPERWQQVFVTANVIAPEQHVRMQAAFQQHCDSAISKTTNFAHAATRDDVRRIYELAYELKCKGVTVYRDGSRDAQVLSTGATAKAAAERSGTSATAPAGETPSRRELGELHGTIAELSAEVSRLKRALADVEGELLQRRAKRSRPDVLRGTSYRTDTPLGTLFVNITEDDRGQPFEVFLNLGKAGGSAMADAEAMGRLISLAFRSGIPVPEIVKQLRGISSDRAVGFGPNKVLSVPDAVGIVLERWVREKQGVQQELPGVAGAGPEYASPTPAVRPSMGGMQHSLMAEQGAAFLGTCPDCGSSLEFAEGCVKCHVCGFSECG